MGKQEILKEKLKNETWKIYSFEYHWKYANCNLENYRQDLDQ